jgi:hypothetical protein
MKSYSVFSDKCQVSIKVCAKVTQISKKSLILWHEREEKGNHLPVDAPLVHQL